MVVSWVVMHFAEKLFEATNLVIQLETIVLRNESHRKAFDNAAVKLKILARDKGVDSEEFRKARDEHKRALSELVQFAS